MMLITRRKLQAYTSYCEFLFLFFFLVDHFHSKDDLTSNLKEAIITD